MVNISFNHLTWNKYYQWHYIVFIFREHCDIFIHIFFRWRNGDSKRWSNIHSFDHLILHTIYYTRSWKYTDEQDTESLGSFDTIEEADNLAEDSFTKTECTERWVTGRWVAPGVILEYSRRLHDSWQNRCYYKFDD